MATAAVSGPGGPGSRGRGRLERSQTQKARSRLPNLRRFYRRRIGPAPAGDFEFRVFCLRPGARKTVRINITPVLESVEWEDDGPVLRGSLVARRPFRDRPASLPISRHDRIRLQIRRGGGWVEVWEMRVEGEPSIDHGSGTLTANLADDLESLRRVRRKWEFRKTKGRPKGWRAHQIAEKVCRELGVPVSKLARGDAWIEKLEMTGTGLDVIKKAYAKEREDSGIRFVVRFRRGRLQVVPFERPNVLYLVGPESETALFDGEPRKNRPRTVLEARGRIDGKKVEVTVAPRRLIRRYGRIPFEHDFGKVSSRSQLRTKARRMLSRELAARRTAQLSIPGVPGIERGSTILLRLNERGWRGPSRQSRNRAYCFVRRARHVISASRYTTDLELVQLDPYRRDERRREKEQREKKRRKRKGRK